MKNLLKIMLGLCILVSPIISQTKWIFLAEGESGTNYYYNNLLIEKNTVTFNGRAISKSNIEIINVFMLNCSEDKAFVLRQETDEYIFTYKKPKEIGMEKGSMLDLIFIKFCGKEG